MHVLTEPLFWLAIAVAVVVVAGVYWFDKRKKSQHKPENHIDNISGTQQSAVVQDEVIIPYMDDYPANIPVRMCDNLLGQIYDTEISKETANKIKQACGTLGRRWDRYGKRIYGLIRYRDEKDETVRLKPILVQSGISNSPTELFNDLQQPEVAHTMSQLVKADEKHTLDDVVKYLPWLAALGFLAFLWAFA